MVGARDSIQMGDSELTVRSPAAVGPGAALDVPADNHSRELARAQRVNSGRNHKAKAAPPADDRIYDLVYRAIIEQQLPPGTKLGEEALCGVFGLNRSRVRQILQRLAFEQLVDLYPNRGAYVAELSVAEAREVFGVRRMLEPPLIETVFGNISKPQMKELQGFVDMERAAQLKRDRQAMIRISGDFHLRIAEMGGNSVLTKMLRQLICRTSLIIAMYEIPGQSGCNCNHHEHLVSLAIEGQARKAAQFMREHLDAIEASLRLDNRPAECIDLQSVFDRITAQ